MVPAIEQILITLHTKGKKAAWCHPSASQQAPVGNNQSFFYDAWQVCFVLNMAAQSPSSTSKMFFLQESNQQSSFVPSPISILIMTMRKQSHTDLTKVDSFYIYHCSVHAQSRSNSCILHTLFNLNTDIAGQYHKAI